MAGREYKPKDKCRFNYICYNEKCDYNEDIDVVEKLYKNQYDEELCEGCGEPMVNKGIIVEEGDSDFSGVVFSKVSLMDKSTKTKMLKKRAKKHFKKNIEEKQRHMIKTTDTAFKKSLNS